MIDNYEIYLSSIQRDRAFAELVGKVQKCKNKINNKRTKRLTGLCGYFIQRYF